MKTAWQDFVAEAQMLYPAFSNEQLIKEVLKSKGAVTFKSEYATQFIKDLKSMVTGWQAFLKDAREIDKVFGDDKTVAKILTSHGIPWYGEFEISRGLEVLNEWHTENIRKNNRWNYPCPICGAETKRDHRFDYMYRRECNGLGWRCSVNGYTHFHTAAWAPLREKLVRFDPVEEQRRQEMILESAQHEMDYG